MYKYSTQHSHLSWIGAAWKVAAFACYAGLDGLARYLSGGAVTQLQPLPVCEIVFFQDVIAFLILIPWYLKVKSLVKISQLPIHLMRGLFSGLAVITWYFALFYLPLGDAVAISVIGPVIGVMLANFFLKEKLNFIRLLVIGCSFFAALYFMRTWEIIHDNQTSLLGTLFVVISAVLFALAKITTRVLAKQGCSARLLTLSLLLFIIPVSLVPALAEWVPVTLAHLGWLTLAGLLTVGAIVCVSKALVYAEITFLAPFDICRYLFNIIVGYFAFTEIPTLWALCAVSLMFFALAWQMRRSLA